MKQLRVGIIGTGMRSASYLHNLSPELRPQVRVVALADPDEGNCAKFERFFANDFFADRHRPRQYESGAELLEAEELDALIESKLGEQWKLSRLDKTMLQLLRAGSFELLARPDVPTATVIDEYVDVAHAFFDGKDAKFVNGLLDAIAKDKRA